MVFLVLFIIPLVLAGLGAWLLKGITWKEFLLQVALQAVIAGTSSAIVYHSNTSDTEVLNGVVTRKVRDEVSCRHSYQCHCITTCSKRGKSNSCSTHCSICYEHSYDVDWDVYSSIPDSTSIETLDRRGLIEPPRWTAVKIGEPYSTQHDFTNYIKAAPGSLFRHQGLEGRYKPYLPPYPNGIYDYYRSDDLVLVKGARVDDPKAWNRELAEINGRIGKLKQVDVVLVLVKNLPQEYFYALEQHWIGGKQNSAVLVVGVDDALTPKWASVMSWNTNKMFEVHLRDQVMDLPRLDRATLLPLLEQEIRTYYHRKPMKDFEYLTSTITPTTSQWTWSLVIGLLAAFVMLGLMHRFDPFGDERRRYW